MLLVLLALTLGSSLQAQGGLLNNGDNLIGSLSPTSPLAIYTFSGTAGEIVTIQVIGISPGLDPAVSLSTPTQQQLAFNDNDPTNPPSSDARISASLPQDGLYVVLVNSVSGVSGDFLIRFSTQPPLIGQTLSNEPVTALVNTESPTQVFTFLTNSNTPATLNLAGEPFGWSFRAVVRDALGQIVALLNASTQAAISLPPGSSSYTVEVSAVDPTTSGQVTILLAAPAILPPGPAATAEVAAPAAPPVQGDSTVCQVGAQGSSPVNVRSGPGTDYAVVTQIAPGVRFTVTGIAGTWYQVQSPEGIGGWVRQDVVVQFGPCNTVPAVPAPDAAVPAPAQTEEVGPAIQATPTYTSTPITGQQPVQATPTYTAAAETQPLQVTATHTYTPTTVQQQPTATHTPTAPAPVAPEDARFNSPLNIPLDSNASTTDFVSFPSGDTEDRVRWDITGMNPNLALPGGQARLVITANCFGTGTDQIRFSTGGRTYNCGDVIVNQNVTYDQRTGSVVITAVGGTNTYVQWVLSGTATRSN
jgi:uncharacterized protein YraI